ncbi:MAG: hypothetical protein K9N00_04315 [Candidatus Marinimicrobia bacterium]|nr:hypothetical protein [Candidatus Neomarinimicrobiota bacterium]
MQNSDNIYNKTNLNILDNKLDALIKEIKNLKERNQKLKDQINKTDTNQSDIDNSKQERIRKKIENMIEELDSVL